MHPTDVIKFCLLIFSILIGIAGNAIAQTQPVARTCVVNEVIHSGGYTYIGCLEGGTQVWLGTPQLTVQNGEQISFSDTPPLYNFTSKSLNRSFSRILFLPAITRSGYSPSGSKSGAQSKNNIVTPYNDTYVGIDDNGTAVFTDDPSKVPKTAKVHRWEQEKHNATALNKFSPSERRDELSPNPSAPLQNPAPIDRINNDELFSEKMRRIVDNSNKAKIQKQRIIEEKNGKVTNYRVVGSLASKNDIGCINIINGNSKLTPPDLYKGVADCINAEKYENASELFALAGMYGSFDAARVSDKTAGQAKTVLIMNTFNGLSEGKRQKFGFVLTDRLSKNKIALRDLCSNIMKIGYPTYHPDYMILHGIKAFTGNPNKGALSETFDPAATWNKLFETYLHCPSGSVVETSRGAIRGQVNLPRNCGQSEKLLQTDYGGLSWYRGEDVLPASLKLKRSSWSPTVTIALPR